MERERERAGLGGRKIGRHEGISRQILMFLFAGKPGFESLFGERGAGSSSLVPRNRSRRPQLSSK